MGPGSRPRVAVIGGTRPFRRDHQRSKRLFGSAGLAKVGAVLRLERSFKHFAAGELIRFGPFRLETEPPLGIKGVEGFAQLNAGGWKEAESPRASFRPWLKDR